MKSSTPVPEEHLVSLTGFPDGTLGCRQELAALKTLNELCKREGYGRISQFARQIEELWRGDEFTVQKFENRRRNRLRFLDLVRRSAAGEVLSEEDEAFLNMMLGPDNAN